MLKTWGSALFLVFGLHAAAAAAVTGEAVERIGDKVMVTWRSAGQVDVYMAAGPGVSPAHGKLLAARDADGKLEVATGAAERPYFLLRDTSDGRTAKVAERALPLEQGSNFRDLGGYPAAGGKHVKWGLIFRSGGTPLLTDADLARIRALGLKEMVDLRSSEERSLAPSRIGGVRYTAVGYAMAEIIGPAGPSMNGDDIGATYRRMPTMLKPQLKIVFDELLAGEGPLAYNCSAGQDRTGFATALILSALGVPRATIYADYHLSTTYRHPEWEMPRFEAARAQAEPVAGFFARYQADPRYRTPQPLLTPDQKPLLAFAFEEIESRYGSVDAYLDKELGVSAADVAKLRALYLE